MITCYALMYKGQYACEDEDVIGVGYQNEINEYSLLFAEESVATREACGDEVVILHISQEEISSKNLKII